MSFSRRKLALVALSTLLCAAGLVHHARGSDHADTPAIASRPGADLTDVFVFPSPTTANNVVLVMNVHPLIPTGMGSATAFDPNVLYQFKIDNVGDHVEHLVIQAKFTGTDPATQQVQIAGPVAPSRVGTVTQFETPDPTMHPINTPFTLSNGAIVFCGAREDPFFFDLEQFFTILPDRASPVFTPTFTNTSGATVSTSPSDPDAPEATSFRPLGQAKDFLAGLNVLSIVVELPKSMLIGTNGKIGVWCTTSI